MAITKAITNITIEVKMNLNNQKNNLIDEEKINEEYTRLSDPTKYVKLAIISLVVIFGSLSLWAAIVPLDEGVPLVGSVVIDTKRKAVQHPAGGVIKEIFVKEGQFVEKDDKLLKLGDSTLKNQLLIEKNNVSSLRESIEGYLSNQINNEAVISSKEIQKSLINEELKGIRELVKEGYAPKVRQLELERQLNSTDESILRLENENKRDEKRIAELNFKLDAALEKVPIIERKISSTLIKANFSGQVIGLNNQSIGGVIQAAEKIMDIVPIDEKLVIEAEVPPNVIDRIRVDDFVDVRFSSFSKSPLLVVQGVVKSISTDILKNKKGTSYYLARIVLTPLGEEDLSSRTMQPGMQAQVIVKTGQRTLLSYIMHPLTRRVASSLTEE